MNERAGYVIGGVLTAASIPLLSDGQRVVGVAAALVAFSVWMGALAGAAEAWNAASGTLFAGFGVAVLVSSIRGTEVLADGVGVGAAFVGIGALLAAVAVSPFLAHRRDEILEPGAIMPPLVAVPDEPAGVLEQKTPASSPEPSGAPDDLNELTKAELYEIAKRVHLRGRSQMRKGELVSALQERRAA